MWLNPLFLCLSKETEATLIGVNGVNVLPNVEEEDAVVIENAPIQNHDMVAKIVRTSGPRRRQKTVI